MPNVTKFFISWVKDYPGTLLLSANSPPQLFALLVRAIIAIYYYKQL